VSFLSKEVDAMLKQQIENDLQHFDPQIDLGSLDLVDKDSKRIQRYLLEDEDIIQVFAFSQNEP
jgi:hypothetical protein